LTSNDGLDYSERAHLEAGETVKVEASEVETTERATEASNSMVATSETSEGDVSVSPRAKLKAWIAGPHRPSGVATR
jgi:hypothetical protein